MNISLSIERMRTLQHNLEYNYNMRKNTREQRYKAFLKEHNNTLPSYETLARWRKTLCYMALLSFIPNTIGTIFFYKWMFKDFIMGFLGIPSITGSMFMVLGCFACTIDWVIHRRFGPNKSFIHW
jgi:hypothetical protein